MADLTSAKQLVRRHARDVMDRTAERVESDTKAASPVDTGELQARTRAGDAHGAGNVIEFDLTADTDYAEIVAKGSRPHIIRPRSARALRFNVGGRVIYARVVHHPGTRPNTTWWSDAALTTRFRSALTRAVATTTTSG